MEHAALLGCPGRDEHATAAAVAAAAAAASCGGQTAACLHQPSSKAPMLTATGQLTYRRAVSKKLVFYDLLCSSPAQQEQAWLEVVVKLGTYSSSLEELAELRSRLKLGDVVQVQGRLSSRHELQATAVSVVQPWRDSHPGQTFRPHPSPLHGGRVQQQAEQQRGQGQQQREQQQEQQPPAEGKLRHLASPADPAIAAALAVAAAPSGGGAAAASAAEAAAVSAAAQAEPVCKFFVNAGSCPKGDACRFAHVHTGALRQQWVADMRTERQRLSSWHGFAHSGGAAAKRRRAQVLAAWLLQTYGRELLNSGEGVLDVAGGAGGVTFELRHVHGIRCTLVDPRPLKLNKPQLRQLQAAGRAAHLCTLTAAQLQQQEGAGAAVAMPAPALLTPDPSQATAGEGIAAGRAAGADPLDFLQVQELFGPELWRSTGWRSRFSRGFSLVLACHPDQATEPALDYALEEGLPFAIVPCCVFPRLFAHRRLVRSGGTQGSSGSSGSGSSGGGGTCSVGSGGDGSSGGSGGSSSGSSSGDGCDSSCVSETVPVLTYLDLVQYLAARGQAQQGVLGFEGANIVVFRDAIGSSP